MCQKKRLYLGKVRRITVLGLSEVLRWAALVRRHEWRGDLLAAGTGQVV